MEPDRSQEGRVHEFRVEGVGLLVGGGALIALLAGAFLLGRFVERREGPVQLAAGPLDHLATEEPPADASRGLTVFDSAAEGQRPLEPRREAARPADRGAPTAPKAAPKPAGEGPYWVQVFAGRDQDGAKDLVTALEQSGWGVRLSSEREGRDTLFRVRVGGYPTEGQAAAAVARLKGAGYPGAFVARPN